MLRAFEVFRRDELTLDLEINNNEVYYIHKTDVYFTFWY